MELWDFRGFSSLFLSVDAFLKAKITFSSRNNGDKIAGNDWLSFSSLNGLFGKNCVEKVGTVVVVYSGNVEKRFLIINTFENDSYNCGRKNFDGHLIFMEMTSWHKSFCRVLQYLKNHLNNGKNFDGVDHFIECRFNFKLTFHDSTPQFSAIGNITHLENEFRALNWSELASWWNHKTPTRTSF